MAAALTPLVPAPTNNALVVSRTVQPVTRNQEATVYVGNLDERVTEAILWELMLQAGPVVHIHIPRDRISQAHQGYGFVEFQGEADAEYASKVMNQVRLHGKPIRVNRATVGANERRAGGGLDVGANLFIGNLAPEVDERMLTDCFGTFGVPILGGPKVARDLETGQSKGYGFVSYDCFEASDAAIEAMNGQFLCNRPITVNYAFKKDGRGERHGSVAERMLAAQSRKAVGNTVAGIGAPSPALSAGPWPAAPVMAPVGTYSQPIYGQLPAYPSSYYPPGYQYYQ